MRMSTVMMSMIVALIGMMAAGTAATGSGDVSPCTFSSPDGSYFDLSRLSSLVDYIDNTTTTQAYDYRMNVCNKVNEPNCATKGGSMCQYYHGGDGIVAVLARPDTPPVWSLIDPVQPQRGLQQTHTSGDPCWKESRMYTRTTIIKFECDPSRIIPGPLTVVEDPATCVYYATLPTALGCPAQPARNCVFTAPDRTFIDMSSLHHQSTVPDYQGYDDTYEYDMNVCGLSNSSNTCALAGGTICQYNRVAHQFINVLGRFDMAPLPTWSYIDSATPTKGVSLRYANGDSCYPASSAPRQATVNFVCDPNAVSPRNFTVVESPSCQYTITMATSVSCSPPPVANCSYTSPSGSRYDLSALYNRPNQPDYTVRDATYEYAGNICGVSSVPSCSAQDGIICQFNGPTQLQAVLARLHASPAPVWALIDSSPKTGVSVTYGNGDRCWFQGAMMARTTIIKFLCDPSAGRGTMRSVLENPECTYVFEFRTAIACPLPSNYDINDHQVDALKKLLAGH